jgi:hypothetical protein
MLLPLFVIAAEWQSLNGPPAGRADDMSMGQHAGQYIIYAADQTHKLYKSTNEGEYWDSIAIAAHPYVTNPICVIADPNEAWTVYICKNPTAPDDHCVWKSEDGGLSWNYRDQGITNPNPLCFAMDPSNSSVVYLGCEAVDDKPVLFRTNDGGFEWRSSYLSDYTINDILVLSFFNEGTVLILATDKGILKGRPYHDFKLVKKGEFKLLKYDKNVNKIFAKGNDKIWQSSDGKKWQGCQSNDLIDFFCINDLIKRRP